MATATHDFYASVPENVAWHQYFNDAEWKRMLADDAEAFKVIATVLSGVITLGFVAIVGTVLWIL